MSSNTAIQDVTRGLQELLLSQLTAVSSAAVVTLQPPGEAFPSGLGVNLYLYRVMESPFTKNQPWPGDRVTGPSDTPALGLELSYLLTPFAPTPVPTATTGDDAHTMLGTAMLTFHQFPILNDVHTTGFDADADLAQDLLNSFERIKIRLAVTSLEELSKIWATINQPYRLSVAYDVSLIAIAPNASSPVNGGIVYTTGVNLAQWEAPRLDGLVPPNGALAHVDGTGALVANSIVINGSGLSLSGRTPAVLIGGQRVTVSTAPPPTNSSLTALLPLTLDAGPNEDVQVSLSGKASTPLSITVNPWLAQLTPIRTTLDASAGPPAPALVLNGSGFTTTPQGVRLDGNVGTVNVAAFVGAVTDNQATITLPATLANGLYQVRIILAGPGNSASNARTLEVIPLVTSPIGLAVVTVSTNQVHQLTVNGARLNGTDVRLVVDGAVYQTGANTNAAQLVFSLGRLLASGQHTVAVVVNGSRSHDIALEVA